MYKPGQILTLDGDIWRIQEFDKDKKILDPCHVCGDACYANDVAWHFCKNKLPLNYHLKFVTKTRRT